ncbi:MerR HTH family regulatory protein [bacterium A37T11]|nr:MerR HTH family regulatory protein [bacterium A37T11]
MKTEWILISEFCERTQIEANFIQALSEEGIIKLIIQEEQLFLNAEELPHIQRYARWYYDMEINVNGIDAMRHLLNKIEMLQAQLTSLQNRLELYE